MSHVAGNALQDTTEYGLLRRDYEPKRGQNFNMTPGTGPEDLTL